MNRSSLHFNGLTVVQRIVFALVIAVGFCFVPAVMAQSPAGDTKKVDYARDVHPVLQKYCGGCHNENDLEGDLSVQSFAALDKGGSEGRAFVAGHSGKSRMMRLMKGVQKPIMPPEDEAQPSAAEISRIAKWIDEGAIGPAAPVKPRLNTPDIEPAAKAELAITSVDWSSQNVIAVSRFRRVQLLDGDSLQILRTIDKFPGKVNSVRFSADGNRLCVAGGITGLSGQASIWKVSDGSKIRVIEGDSDALYHAVESPTGNWIATASYDRRVKIWDAATGKLRHDLQGHNGAVYDLDFDGTSQYLVSASGDSTIKVWGVEDGRRLDTHGEPLKEQFATRFSPDGRYIVGGGRDHRIRVWEFVSHQSAGLPDPVIHSRFAHEQAIVGLEYSRDGKRLVSTAEDRSIKVWDTERMEQIACWEDQPAIAAAVAVSPDGTRVFVGRMDGSTEVLSLTPLPGASAKTSGSKSESDTGDSKPADADLADASEAAKLQEAEPNDRVDDALEMSLPAVVTGAIHVTEENGKRRDVDVYGFTAEVAQPILFTIKAARMKSRLDSYIEILDSNGKPVPRVLLRAVRDSYFAFRGKDSSQIGDFRIHNAGEMRLNDFLYCKGEVVKLFQHPRGPDSGFNVYPGRGKRHGFFGTTGMTHALHEPCYVVDALPVGTPVTPNGLPTFTINYENDDDARRELGSDSRLLFTAPKDGRYFVRVSDVRGDHGKDFKYELSAAYPQPDYSVRLSHGGTLRRGSGQEFAVTAKRKDGFDGEIRIELENVPASLMATKQLVIEANHDQAFGVLQWNEGEPPTAEEIKAIKLRASAMLGTREIKREANGFGEIKFEEESSLQVRVVRMETKIEDVFQAGELKTDDVLEPMVFEVRPGERMVAKVVVSRRKHKGRISFGSENSGRNLPHGVYVDDIGLNGLLITEGNSEQRFFIAVEPWVKPMTRRFHLKAEAADKPASLPVVLKVLSKEAE